MPLADLWLLEGSSLRSRTTLGGMCCKAASEDSEEVPRPGMSSCSVVQCTGAVENVNRQELQNVNRNTIARIPVSRNLKVSRGVFSGTKRLWKERQFIEWSRVAGISYAVYENSTTRALSQGQREEWKLRCRVPDCFDLR